MDRVFWNRTISIARKAVLVFLGLTLVWMILRPNLPREIGDALKWGTLVLLFLAVLSFLAWIVAHLMRWWLRGPLRWGPFAPESHLLAAFDSARRDATGDGLYLVRIKRIYQAGRQGSKCVVEHPFGVFQDAWCWHARPGKGRVYVVRGSAGYGPHSNNLHVMYIGSKQTGAGLIYSLSPWAWKAARRRHRASVKASPRSR